MINGYLLGIALPVSSKGWRVAKFPQLRFHEIPSWKPPLTSFCGSPDNSESPDIGTSSHLWKHQPVLGMYSFRHESAFEKPLDSYWETMGNQSASPGSSWPQSPPLSSNPRQHLPPCICDEAFDDIRMACKELIAAIVVGITFISHGVLQLELVGTIETENPWLIPSGLNIAMENHNL